MDRPQATEGYEIVIIGSGCAAYNAADWLHCLGKRRIAVITEDREKGTSRNAGSDKQTYYKLSSSGTFADSVAEMAQDLFAGGCVNGDTALCEAASSMQCFMKLVNLGVPFPRNEYGEFVGYRTDHDHKRRATSAGPLTSMLMTQVLEHEVMRKGITILDGMMAFQLFTVKGRVKGVFCLELKKAGENDFGLRFLPADKVILATGGPAACYSDVVYPEGQTGMSGMALEAGALGCNLNEWQYGLASTAFRWNVSGTYQQALPRYVSIDENGVEREFLMEEFPSPQEAVLMVFKKGYEWPFDSAKLDGSSRLDMSVYRETVERGRRVYLDYRREWACLEHGFEGLNLEVKEYLARSGALQDTPLKRLQSMNPQAVTLYRSHGIDLSCDLLEIRLCAQHQNGGLDVDQNWETSVKGLYAVGEAAGTFGVRRPGGSALNSGQVGAMRAAEHICRAQRTEGSEDVGRSGHWIKAALDRMLQWQEDLKTLCSCGSPGTPMPDYSADMTSCAAQCRNEKQMKELVDVLRESLEHFPGNCRVQPGETARALKLRDTWITQISMLSAMLKASECGRHDLHQVVTSYSEGKAVSSMRPVRPIPRSEQWFETVWKKYSGS